MVFLNFLSHVPDPHLPPFGELLGQAFLRHQTIAHCARSVCVRGDDVKGVPDDTEDSLSFDRLPSLSHFVWKVGASYPHFIVVAHMALAGTTLHRFIKRSAAGPVVACVDACDPLQELPQEGTAAPHEGETRNTLTVQTYLAIEKPCVFLMVFDHGGVSAKEVFFHTVEIAGWSLRRGNHTAVLVKFIAWEFSDETVRAQVEVARLSFGVLDCRDD